MVKNTAFRRPAADFRVHKFHWEDLKLDTKTNSPASPFPKVSARKNTLGTAKTSWDFKQSNKIWRSEDLFTEVAAADLKYPSGPNHYTQDVVYYHGKLSELRHANKRGPPRNGQVEPMNFPSTLSHKTVAGVDLFDRHLLLLQHTIQLGSLSPQMCDIVSQLMGYQFFPANKNFRLKISWASSQHVGLKLTLTLVVTVAYSRVSSHRSCRMCLLW